MGRPYFEMTRSSAGSLQFWPESPTRMKRVFDLETGLWFASSHTYDVLVIESS